MKQKKLVNLFLSSIRQDIGKTTVSLGLFQALQDMKYRMTFMKPVGQKVVPVGDANIDKDSYLIGEVFHCGKKYKEMSPVAIGRGFTENYIMHPRKPQLGETIKKAFKVLTRNKDAILVEGTGHAGVGSVIDFSNADVASLLGSKVIIISEGGIGRCIDEIMLNKALFDMRGVEVIGAIINKVLPEKYDKIKKILNKGLARKGIKLLGVLPTKPFLSIPTIEQIMEPLRLKLISGKFGVMSRVQNIVVAAMEPHNMIHDLHEGTLVLASGDRVDNILLAVSSHLVREGRHLQISGIILTGGLMPNEKIAELLKKSEIPLLFTEDDTYRIAARLENLICKIQKTDKDKIDEARRMVKKYVDVKEILKTFN